MKPMMISEALPASRAGAPPALPKKNEIGTSSASEIRCSRPAPMRFTPFSYFCTCWKVTPIRSASSVWDRRHSSRRERTRRPTSASRLSARLARTCLSIILACFMLMSSVPRVVVEVSGAEIAKATPDYTCYFPAISNNHSGL